jgi:hypothetical protein
MLLTFYSVLLNKVYAFRYFANARLPVLDDIVSLSCERAEEQAFLVAQL